MANRAIPNVLINGKAAELEFLDNAGDYPAIRFHSDPDCGFSRNAAGEIVAEKRVFDGSTGRVVITTATALSLTVTEHGDRVVLINTNSTVANTFTLPVATGSGVKFTLINNIAQTQGSIVVAANGTTDTLKGMVICGDTTAETAMAFVTSASSDKASLNRTTTGGIGPGDIIECYDGTANVWSVQLRTLGSGTLATPFSET